MAAMASAEALCFLVSFPNPDCVVSLFPAVKRLDLDSRDDDRAEVFGGISSMCLAAESRSIRPLLPGRGLSPSAASRRSSSSASARDIVLRAEVQGQVLV